MDANSQAKRVDYVRKSIRRKRWKKIVSILACVVVFCTTYALILPAITMSKPHKVLACPLDVHTHSAACYDGGDNLICGYADFVVHTHREECYDADGNLICQLPEIKAHKHTAACYEEVKTLTCPLEESEEHTHTDECYTIEEVLLCDNNAVLHKHTADCYDVNSTLICGKVEVTEHIHQDGCFITVKGTQNNERSDAADEREASGTGNTIADIDVIAAAELLTMNVSSKAKMLAAAPMKAGATPNNAEGIDLRPMITSVNVEHREAGTELWLDLDNGAVKVGEEILFTLNYEIPAETLDTNNRTLYYEVPDDITLTMADSGDVYNGGNVAVGTYNIDQNGNITIVFDQQYAQENARGSKINGYIAFSAAVNDIRAGDGGDVNLPFSDTISVPIHVYDTTGDLNVEKSSRDVDFFNGTLTYEIVVSSAHGTDDIVTLEDTMYAMELVGDITVTDKYNNPVTMTRLQSGNLGLFQLPQMGDDSEYHITYAARCTKDFNEKTITGTNTVKVTSKDSAGNPVEAKDDTANSFAKKIMQKSGTLAEDGAHVNWEIIINASTPRMNVSGWTLSDTYNGTTATIKPNPVTGDGDATITLPYVFPDDRVCDDKYIITYTTAGDDNSTNTATMSYQGRSTSAEAGVDVGEVTLDKRGITMYSSGFDASGNKLMTCEWDITLDAVTVPVMTKNTTVLGETGQYWELREYASENKHFFTNQQLTQTAANMAAAIDASGYSGGYYIFASAESGLRADLDTSGVVLLQRGGTADDRWDAYDHAPQANVEYKNIYIIFDSDLHGSLLNFKAYTTKEVGAGTSDVRSRNNVILTAEGISENEQADLSYKPMVSKVDYQLINKKMVNIWIRPVPPIIMRTIWF